MHVHVDGVHACTQLFHTVTLTNVHVQYTKYTLYMYMYMYECVSYSDLHLLTVFWAAGSEVLWSVVWWRTAAAPCPRGASETAGGRPPA